MHMYFYLMLVGEFATRTHTLAHTLTHANDVGEIAAERARQRNGTAYGHCDLISKK